MVRLNTHMCDKKNLSLYLWMSCPSKKRMSYLCFKFLSGSLLVSIIFMFYILLNYIQANKYTYHSIKHTDLSKSSERCLIYSNLKDGSYL